MDIKLSLLKIIYLTEAVARETSTEFAYTVNEELDTHPQERS